MANNYILREWKEVIKESKEGVDFQLRLLIVFVNTFTEEIGRAKRFEGCVVLQFGEAEFQVPVESVGVSK